MPSKTKKSSKGARKLNQTIRIPISRSSELSKYGYKNIRKTSEKKRRESLVRFITSVGDDKEKQIKKAGKVIQKLNALAIVQKNRQPEFSRRVRRDQKYVSKLLLNLKKGEMIGKGLIPDPETGLLYDPDTDDLYDPRTGVRLNKRTGIISRILPPKSLPPPPPDSTIDIGGHPDLYYYTGIEGEETQAGEMAGKTTGPGLADLLPTEETTGPSLRFGAKRRTRRNK